MLVSRRSVAKPSASWRAPIHTTVADRRDGEAELILRPIGQRARVNEARPDEILEPIDAIVRRAEAHERVEALRGVSLSAKSCPSPMR